MSDQNISITGQFVNLRKWSMRDDDGQAMKGTTLHLLVPQDQSQKSSDFVGLTIDKLSGEFSLFDTIDQSLLNKKVSVVCSLSKAGKGYKAKPLSVSLAK
ncbi:MAG: hypothetical protein QM503_10990 [Bacteroidota bacterium]